MPLYVLKEEMPYDELCSWVRFFNKRPIGWREDYRAYMIMRAFGVKGSPAKIFDSLKPLFESSVAGSLKGSGALQMLLSAKGGDRLEILHEL